MDETSKAIGSLEAVVSGLGRSLDRDRREAERRHGENTVLLDAIDRRLQTVEISRWKVLGGIAVVSWLLVGLGWLVAHAWPLGR